MTRRTARAVSACCAIILLLGLAHAGELLPVPDVPPPEPPPPVPALHVRGAERPVRLQTLAVQATIQGGVAEISLDMLFFNPNNRVLEGELRFPLLPGQEISGLALDVGGEMRSGVPVPKARGQEIFEDVARRNVDPALLEATQGNAYKLRVYPIPAKGTRRVAVRVLQPLTPRNGLFTLRLPLGFAKHLDAFSVEALVAASEPPRVESGSLGLVLEKAGSLYRGKAEKADFAPEGWLEIGVPASASPAEDVNAVRWKDKIYFTASAFVETQSRKRALPDLATIVWDASASGLNRDHAREFALLDRYFAAFGDGRARLVVVRNAAEAPREFAIRGGDWGDLKTHLAGLDYDGGTDLACWKPTDDCAEYLLFTDGLANFGRSLGGDSLPATLPGQRLHAVVASVDADRNLLRHASRGRLVDLMRHDGEAAARLLLEDFTELRLVPGDLAGKGEALLDPAVPSEEGGSNRRLYRLAGWINVRNNAKAETISLLAEHPDGARETFAVAIPQGADAPSHAGEDAPLPARLWGRHAIAELEANAHLHKAAIERLGRELGVVSRETSLIVLETAADYARYDVTPPASLKAEVERLRSENATAGDTVARLPIDRLERMWAEKVAWWERDFSGTKPRKPKVREEMETGVVEDAAFYAATDSFASRSEPPMPAAAGADGDPLRLATFASAPTADFALSARESHPDAPRAGNGAPPAIGIALQAWKSDAPYIGRMNRAKKEDMYAIYLDERPSHSRSGAFYLDMADRFFAAGLRELGLRVLSNLAEIEVENRQLLRMLAYRLLEAKEAASALGILEKVRELAPYEPQSLRDLAGVHVALGDRERAVGLLYEVATRVWDGRFADVNVIALTELNALVATAEKPLDTTAFDRRLLKNLPSDLRVTLAWDADNTDMDLWITDPNGEKCYYENRLTAQGGALSRDCTGGYGPEEFMLRKALPGVYRIEVDYYGDSQQILSGEVTLYVTLTTGFGTPEQSERVVTMRLKDQKDTVLAGEFTVQ